MEKQKLPSETGGPKEHMEFIHKGFCHRGECWCCSANRGNPCIGDMVDEGVVEGAGDKTKHTSIKKLPFFLICCYGSGVSVSSFDNFPNSISRKGVPDLHMPDGVVGLSDKDRDARKNLTINFDFRSGEGSHVICLEEI